MFVTQSKSRLHQIPEEDRTFEKNYKLFASIVIGATFVLTLLYGLSVADQSRRMAALMAAFLAAAAPFAVGGFVGFLFGIPRTLQESQAKGTAQATAMPGASAKSATATPIATSMPTPDANPELGNSPAWQANTNLEQISDWLTKIIVGIGLTQLTHLPAAVESTGGYIATAISPHAPAVVGSLILIVFSISGFLTAYVMTKSDLAREIDVLEKRRHGAA